MLYYFHIYSSNEVVTKGRVTCPVHLYTLGFDNVRLKGKTVATVVSIITHTAVKQ